MEHPPPSLQHLNKEITKHRKEYMIYIVSLIVGVIVCAFLFNVFLEITNKIGNEEIAPFDKKISDYIYSFRSKDLTDFAIFVTNLGDVWAYTLIIPLFAAFFYSRGKNWKLILQGTLVLVSTYFLNLFIKFIVSRPRPIIDERLVSASYYSYPSGHSMSAIAFYGFIIYLTAKYIRNKSIRYALVIIQLVFIGIIGLSRVYLGVHFPSDVIAGFVIGLCWLVFCIMCFQSMNFYRRKNRKKRPPIKKLKIETE